MESLEKFIDIFNNRFKDPPYFIFLFIGAVLAFISISFNKYFEQVWLFFLYSVLGILWRHCIKDLKNESKHILLYHIVNIIITLILISIFLLK